MTRRARLPLAAHCLLIGVVVVALFAAGALAADGASAGNARATHQKADRGTAGAKRQAGRCRGRRHARVNRKRIRRCRKRQASTLYWGATIGSHLTGTQAPWDMNAVSQFQGMTGKPLSLVQFFTPFANCASGTCSYYDFPTVPMENVRKYGAIPFLSWSSASLPSSNNQPDFQLSDVIAGTHDDYIRRFATTARNWGRPFFLRFNWEMNGDWFSWSEGVNGNQPGQYAAAWRHVHDIFTSVGANNATWVWCPHVDYNNTMQSMSSLYPGDGYVDWTCLDGYSWGSNPNAQFKGYKTFDEIFRSSYRRIARRIAPGKPMIIGETAASEYGGSKASWIKDMLSKLPTDYPKIRGLLWFEKNDSNMDWPLTTSSAATSAFAEGISKAAYTTNTYANLTASPIQPPTTYYTGATTSLKQSAG
jgi:hypothetical protein